MAGKHPVEPAFQGADGKLKKFDFVVANPPFSDKAWSTGLDPTTMSSAGSSYGAPPAKNGDYAYLLHMLALAEIHRQGAWSSCRTACCSGAMPRPTSAGSSSARGYIKGIIGLPANLFYGTGIPACLIVIDKEHAAARTGIFMIDASKGFMKDGHKNRLRTQDVHKIVDVFQRVRSRLPAIRAWSRRRRSSKNDCNLNIPRYIDSSEAEDLQDIEAHLQGGIPARDVDALQEYWEVMPGLRDRSVRRRATAPAI